jgi:hypothetical protein
VPAKDPVSHGVKGATPQRREVAAEQFGNAPHHLLRGLVGERQQQQTISRDALFEQEGNPVGERAGLARAGAGDHERRPGGGGDGGQLLRVQLARVVDLQIDGGAERAQRVVARHGVKVASEAEIESGNPLVRQASPPEGTAQRLSLRGLRQGWPEARRLRRRSMLASIFWT